MMQIPGDRRASEAQEVIVVDAAILTIAVVFVGCIWSARAYRRAAQAARHAEAIHAWARGGTNAGLAPDPHR
jgi:hypothetical protein